LIYSGFTLKKVDSSSINLKKMNNFSKTLERMKFILGVENDAEVAEIIGMKPSAFSNRKKSGSIPFSHYLKALEPFKVNLNWLVDGSGPIYKDGSGGSEKDSDNDTPSKGTKRQKKYNKITQVVIEHQDMVREFLDPDKAKKINRYLIEIEKKRPRRIPGDI
jgi:hypothetical protein